MCFLDVTEDNILHKTREFIEKAKKDIEKPKDEPRYKTVVEYESEFKQAYVNGLKAAIKITIKQYKKHINDGIATVSDSGATKDD